MKADALFFYPFFRYLCGLCTHRRARIVHMERTQAKNRIDELKALLWENSRLYYVENAPVMSDYEYDQRMHELEALEAEWPEFATAVRV